MLIKITNFQQTRISELLQNSGDNSSQLISLNENLKEKEAKIEELQSSLNVMNQELIKLKEENGLHLSKLNQDLEKLNENELKLKNYVSSLSIEIKKIID